MGVGNFDHQKKPVPLSFLNDNKLQLYTGGSHSLALSEKGVLYAFGNNLYGQLGINSKISQNLPVPVSFFRNQKIKNVFCGINYSLVQIGRCLESNF